MDWGFILVGDDELEKGNDVFEKDWFVDLFILDVFDILFLNIGIFGFLLLGLVFLVKVFFFFFLLVWIFVFS